jgi:hypothetical protein
MQIQVMIPHPFLPLPPIQLPNQNQINQGLVAPSVPLAGQGSGLSWADAVNNQENNPDNQADYMVE